MHLTVAVFFTLNIRVHDHIKQSPQNRIGGGVSASNEEISYDIKEIILCEAAFLFSGSLLGQHLHQVHVCEIPWIVRIQCFTVLCNNPLKENSDVSFHLTQLLENPKRQKVEQRENVDENCRAVHADLQPSLHQLQHGAELPILVMEAPAQDQCTDDV